MPNLPSFSLVDQRVKKYRRDYLLESAGEAFGWVVLEAVLKLNAGEIIDTIVDDGMDGGIDAVHLSERDVHIFTYTYTESFENTSNNFPQNKMDNLLVTVQKIMAKTLVPGDVNHAIWEKIQDIWGMLAVGSPNLHFHICSNKEYPTSVAKRRFEDGLRPFRFVSFNYVSLEDLVSLILERPRRRVNGQVSFIDRAYFPKADGPMKATVAAIAATDLITLMRDPEDENRINEDIFNENVRVDLGSRNAINRSILDSALAETNYEFWYLNNGVTLVCEECEYIPNSRSPRVTLKNVQIVNGGQTTRTLFQAHGKDPEKLDNVEVLLRIIETRDRTISEKISESANRQTPVTTRDLRANDWIQRKLEEEFRSLGYYYERKKNQHADQPIKERLDAETVGQVFLAFDLDMPAEAKNQKTMVFGEKYADIFDEAKRTAKELLFPMLLYKPIEDTKREIQRKKRKMSPVTDEEAFVSLATFHILNSMKLVARQESLNLEEAVHQKTARQKAISLIGEVVKREMANRGELYTHDRFFKQRETNGMILSHILSSYGEDSGNVQ